MSRILSVFAALAVLTSGCQRNTSAVDESADANAAPPIVDESVKELARNNAEFALSLYEKLRMKPGNIVFSPYSISAALAMTYDGARGETAEQMANVLRFPAERERLHPAFRNLHGHLVQKADGYELSIANALWGQQGLEFEPEFRKNNQDYYGAGLRFVDFITREGRERARQTINEWTRNQTRNKIPELLVPRDLDEHSRLVLTNAIYSKGDWAQAFDEKLTATLAFQCPSDRQVMVPMMHASDVRLPYFAANEVEILEMPYRGKRLSFVVMLPSPKTDLASFENGLTTKTIASLLANLKTAEVQVTFPRLRLKQRAYLKNHLKSMGMPLPFINSADFTGMTRQESLFIDKVIHEATLDIDEKGAVAAAATAVIMKGEIDRGEILFIVNRPFLFLIRDRQTGSILFMGRVVDPSLP